MSADDDRLVDGGTIAEVLAEDDRQREREQAERDDATLDAYLERQFGVPAPKRPQSQPAPASSKDPDLHAGARRNAEPDTDTKIDSYLRHHRLLG